MNKNIKELAQELSRYELDTNTYPDDFFALTVCQEALLALQENNYGIGALLINENREIIVRAHNQTFNPYFRSDLHAEMVAINKFERQFSRIIDISKCTLYVSLEPCTMCLGRIIFSRVGKILYVAEDPTGGMVRLIEHLPVAWQQLTKESQSFGLANCSENLRKLAIDLLMLNASALDQKLHTNKI